ncbi:SDR family oxidoreductase [Phenylobacterium sp.]|uniref:SDR family oxidoreductase n=1 Tax=Phenylobacterium sp. TaxID=1871053 RepID=UPI0035B0FD25
MILDGDDYLRRGKVLVTGASAGIGEITARRLMAYGVSVLAVDRVQPAFQVDEFIRADLSAEAEIDKVVGAIKGPLAGIVCAAGLGGRDGEMIAKVNYLGLRALVERAMPLLAPGGSVVSIGSSGGWQFQARLEDHIKLSEIEGFDAQMAWIRSHDGLVSAYGYLKEALIVWTMMRAPVFRKAGLRINCVSPGPFQSALLTGLRETSGEDWYKSLVDRAGPPPPPEDLAPLVHFLLSPESRHINGANIPIDGGLLGYYITTNNGPKRA